MSKLQAQKVCRECGKPFRTAIDRKVYCSWECQKRINRRRYRQTHKDTRR